MELADELGVSTVVVVAVCDALGIDARWAGAELSDEDAARIRHAGPPPPAALAPSPPPPLVAPVPTGAIPGFSGMAPSAPPPPPPRALPVGMATAHVHPTARPLTRRRDPRVSTGWSRWWRGVVIVICTYIALVIVALFASATFAINDAYQTGQPTGSVGTLALITLLWLAMTSWSTLVFVRGASTALEAWTPIGESGGMLKGRLSIGWLTYTAVSACVWLAWTTIVSVLQVVRAL